MLDSFGIGEEPDADKFGDVGANTLGSISKSPNFNTPNLKKLGMFNIEGVTCGEKEAAPVGSFARLRERSNGKDTTIGHWEIAGVTSNSNLVEELSSLLDSLVRNIHSSKTREVALRSDE